MEFFSNHLSFFFLLLITLLSSCQIHARDNQFFNKIHTTNINNDHIEKETKVVVTPNKDQEPNVIPKNENAYGVYGHELGQLPPSTPTTNLIPNNKYLPKNYNSVAYVTVPQYNTDETNTMNSNNQRYNSGRGSSDHDHYYIGDNTYNNNNNNNNKEYYISGNTYDHYYKSDSTYDNNEDNNNNQYYNSVNTYNDQYHNGGRAGSKVMTTSTESYLNGDGREYYYIKKDQLQDMNEPRSMDKGYATATSYKNGGNNFYYNNQEQSPNTKTYVKNPYEKSREFANSYIGNNELSNNNNNFVNYENDEEHMP